MAENYVGTLRPKARPFPFKDAPRPPYDTRRGRPGWRGPSSAAKAAGRAGGTANAVQVGRWIFRRVLGLGAAVLWPDRLADGTFHEERFTGLGEFDFFWRPAFRENLASLRSVPFGDAGANVFVPREFVRPVRAAFAQGDWAPVVGRAPHVDRSARPVPAREPLDELAYVLRRGSAELRGIIEELWRRQRKEALDGPRVLSLPDLFRPVVSRPAPLDNYTLVTSAEGYVQVVEHTLFPPNTLNYRKPDGSFDWLAYQAAQNEYYAALAAAEAARAQALDHNRRVAQAQAQVAEWEALQVNIKLRNVAFFTLNEGQPSEQTVPEEDIVGARARRHRDRKSRGRNYRQWLGWINATYGEVDEGIEVYRAFLNAVFVESDSAAALRRLGDVRVFIVHDEHGNATYRAVPTSLKAATRFLKFGRMQFHPVAFVESLVLNTIEDAAFGLLGKQNRRIAEEFGFSPGTGIAL